MSRTVRYIADWKNPLGVRYRLTFTPWAKYAPGIPLYLSVGTPPAFGSGTASGYVRLPEGVILAETVQLPEVGFESIPAGMVQAPTLKLRLNLAPCEGVADDFITYVADPANASITYEKYGSTQYGDQIIPPDLIFYLVGLDLTETAGERYRYIVTANCWRLDTDDGNGALGVSSFRTVFEGTQRPLYGEDAAELVWEVNPLSGANLVDVEIVDIVLTCAEQILPSDISRRCLSVYGSSLSDPHYTFYDVVWKDSTRFYRRTLGSGTGPLLGGRLFPQALVWSALGDLLGNVYRLMTRNEFGALSLISQSLPGGLTTPQVGPYATHVLWQQGETAAGTAGALPLDDSEAAQTRQIIAQFVFSDDDDVPVGGYLADDGSNSDSIFRYRSAYEMLQKETEAAGAMGQSVHLSQTLVSIIFSGVRTTTRHTITADEARAYTPTQKIETNARILTEITWEIPGAENGDASPVTITSPLLPPDGGYTLPVGVHTTPHVGDIDDVAFAIGSWSGGNIETARSALRMAAGIWYLKTITDLTAGPVPIRAHHYTGISNGESVVYPLANGIALPSPDLGNDTGAEDWRTWWGDLRLAMYDMGVAGVPAAIAQFLLDRYSDRTQCAYPATVRAEIAGTDQVGKRGPTSWTNGSDWTAKTIHAQYPGQPILLSTAINCQTQTAEVKLLGVPNA